MDNSHDEAGDQFGTFERSERAQPIARKRGVGRKRGLGPQYDRVDDQDQNAQQQRGKRQSLRVAQPGQRQMFGFKRRGYDRARERTVEKRHAWDHRHLDRRQDDERGTAAPFFEAQRLHQCPRDRHHNGRAYSHRGNPQRENEADDKESGQNPAIAARKQRQNVIRNSLGQPGLFHGKAVEEYGQEDPESPAAESAQRQWHLDAGKHQQTHHKDGSDPVVDNLGSPENGRECRDAEHQLGDTREAVRRRHGDDRQTHRECDRQ